MHWKRWFSGSSFSVLDQLFQCWITFFSASIQKWLLEAENEFFTINHLFPVVDHLFQFLVYYYFFCSTICRQEGLPICAQLNLLFQKKLLKMDMSDKKCVHFNSGYCKFNDKGCKFFHPTESCSENSCSDKKCNKRHPRKCKYKELE